MRVHGPQVRITDDSGGLDGFVAPGLTFTMIRVNNDPRKGSRFSVLSQITAGEKLWLSEEHRTFQIRDGKFQLRAPHSAPSQSSPASHNGQG